MLQKYVQTLFLAVLLTVSVDARAEFISICHILAARDLFVENFTSDFSDEILTDGNTTLQLGNLLGKGIAGSAYTIESINSTAPFGRLIAKVPHKISIVGVNLPYPFGTREVRNELENMKLIQTHSESVNKKLIAQLGHAPAWTQGGPGVAIMQVLNTRIGTVLVKPHIAGAPKKSLLQAWLRNGFPKDALDSLNEMLLYAQILFQETNGLVGLDLNPTNFAWVDDPETLQNLGFTRPSFILFEYGRYLSNKYGDGSITPEALANEIKGVWKK